MTLGSKVVRQFVCCSRRLGGHQSKGRHPSSTRERTTTGPGSWPEGCTVETMKERTVIAPLTRLVPLDLVEVSSRNVRTNLTAGTEDGGVVELAASIEAQGLLNPPLLRQVGNGRFEVVAGQRRVSACRFLGWAQVPALVRVLDDAEAVAASLAENVQRADMDPMDKARAVAALEEMFGSIPAVARRLGLTVPTVRRYHSLLALAPKLQARAETGAGPAGLGFLARLAETFSDPADQAAVYDKVGRLHRGSGQRDRASLRRRRRRRGRACHPRDRRPLQPPYLRPRPPDLPLRAGLGGRRDNRAHRPRACPAHGWRRLSVAPGQRAATTSRGWPTWAALPKAARQPPPRRRPRVGRPQPGQRTLTRSGSCTDPRRGPYPAAPNIRRAESGCTHHLRPPDRGRQGHPGGRFSGGSLSSAATWPVSARLSCLLPCVDQVSSESVRWQHGYR